MESLLSVRHVKKYFHQGDVETRVLEDINLEVFSGDYIVLMAPSGSGKTTLLNIISGLDDPTDGSVSMKGDVITGAMESTRSKWRSEHIGFIFQQYHLMPTLTAFENVELPLLLFDLSRKDRRRRVEAALIIVGLSDRLHYYPRQLSGGQQQRVGVARAIVTDPNILIADEPTGNLDYDSTSELLVLFDVLNNELGKTMIIVTHDPRVAEKAHKEYRLDRGKLIDLGRPAKKEQGH